MTYEARLSSGGLVDYSESVCQTIDSGGAQRELASLVAALDKIRTPLPGATTRVTFGDGGVAVLRRGAPDPRGFSDDFTAAGATGRYLVSLSLSIEEHTLGDFDGFVVTALLSLLTRAAASGG